MAWDLKTLQEGAIELGFSLTQIQLSQFDKYLSLLLEWNQHTNLTAITDPVDIQNRLFLNSLACAVITGDLSHQRVVDVGSGAGIPGLPLKILFSQMHLTLLESVAKKARFLGEVCQLLAFENVDIVVERAERIGKDVAFRESYDWVLARAVAPMNVLVEYLFPLCKVNGRILAPKGENARAEIETAIPAIKILGGGPVKIFPEQPYGEKKDKSGQVKNMFVLIRKIHHTPNEYPRRIGIPSKRPL